MYLDVYMSCIFVLRLQVEKVAMPQPFDFAEDLTMNLALTRVTLGIDQMQTLFAMF